ncbi:MAG: acyl carrier protein [Solirubrobacteraceae bacterium]|nr:acyl carrier protein [Solirubrobacteraceae bacterium]
MTRDDVLTLVREHLADELDIDESTILESSRFKEDLSADSLDLYTLTQELEDTYGVKIPEEDAMELTTVGLAVDYVAARAGAAPLADR